MWVLCSGKKTMLRKRSRSPQEHSKGQLMGDLSSSFCFSSDAAAEQKAKSSPFFSVPGLLVSVAGKGFSSDYSNSMKSPTSPLDYRLFSNFNSSLIGSPRSPGRSWDCNRVGLSLLDSLRDEKIPGRSESKNIVLGSQMRIMNMSSPKNHYCSTGDEHHEHKGSPFSQLCSSKLELDELENIDSCSNEPKPNSDAFTSTWKSYQLGSQSVSIDLIHGCMGSLSASEIELSEDYTCIISHGPNPKTTHIFGNCIMVESQDSENKHGREGGGSHWIVKSSANSPPFPSNDFLSFCNFCSKKLDEGKDIYMYRGEKAFCSCSCRNQVILIEEKSEMEKSTTTSCDSPSSPSFHEDLFLDGMVVAS